MPFDYEQYEKILMQRCSIYDTANIKAGRRTWIPLAKKSNLFFTIKQAITAGCPNDAFVIINKMRSELADVSDQMELSIEEAKLNAKINWKLAKKCLTTVIEDKQTEKDLVLKCKAHQLHGELLAENYASSTSDINKVNFKVAHKLLMKYAKYHNKEHLIPGLDNQEHFSQFSQALSEEVEDDVDSKIKSCTTLFDTIAKYFDRDYLEKFAYVNSLEYKEKKKILSRNKEKLDRMKADKKEYGNQDFRKSLVILQRSVELDERELKETESEMKTAAKTAL